MNTGPLNLFLALTLGALLTVVWAGFVGWILYLVATRPELDPKQHDRAAPQLR